MVKSINGGRYADGRGVLRFCNGFDMMGVRRFYTIANSAECPRRGWIGHRRESKWFFPLVGVSMVWVERMEGGTARECYKLEAQNPQILEVPGGNWFLVEQEQGAEVMVFSNCRMGEFVDDDFRKEDEG